MRVTLHITAGPAAGRRIDLRDGLTASIGRSEWADFNVENDRVMAEVHFTVRCESRQCLLEPVQTAPTLLNGEPTGPTRLHTADRVQAGKSEFTLEIEGDLGRQDVDENESSEPVEVPVVMGAVALASHLDLDDDLVTLAEESSSEQEFLSRLIEQEHYFPACRVQAHLLEPGQAVRWGIGCVEHLLDSNLVGEQAEAFEAARKWADEPNEEHRRNAEAAAANAEFVGPGGALAAGAFWSGGSLAPLDAPEPVEPDERLTGQAVANALLFACVAKQPERMPEKLRECLEMARNLVDAKSDLPARTADAGP